MNELEPNDDNDMNRLNELRDGPSSTWNVTSGCGIPDEVAHGLPARDLLLIASQKGKRRTYACVVLKVMHVMHHLAGRELLTGCRSPTIRSFTWSRRRCADVEEIKARAARWSNSSGAASTPTA